MIMKAYMDDGVVSELAEIYRTVTPEQIHNVFKKIVEGYNANNFRMVSPISVSSTDARE